MTSNSSYGGWTFVTGPQKKIVRLLVVAMFALSSGICAAQEGLALKFGTWKLNAQKSQFPPGAQPQSDTRVYEDRGGGVIMSTHTTVNAQGQEGLTIYAAKFDDKEYPVVTRGSGVVSSIRFHLIDAYSESFVLTRDGKVAVQGTTIITKDGKTMTMTLDTTNSQGQIFHGISIYEKQ
jgi:hypothetical protein